MKELKKDNILLNIDLKIADIGASQVYHILYFHKPRW